MCLATLVTSCFADCLKVKVFILKRSLIKKKKKKNQNAGLDNQRKKKAEYCSGQLATELSYRVNTYKLMYAAYNLLFINLTYF